MFHLSELVREFAACGDDVSEEVLGRQTHLLRVVFCCCQFVLLDLAGTRIFKRRADLVVHVAMMG